MRDILIEFYQLFYINVTAPFYYAVINSSAFETCYLFVTEILYYIYRLFCKQDIPLSFNEFKNQFGIIGGYSNLVHLTSQIITLVIMIVVIRWVLRMITSPFKYISNGGGINDEKITYESKRKGKKNKRKGTY